MVVFMKTFGIFEAKTHFTSLCDEVVRSGQPALVSKRGKPLVMVTPVPAEIVGSGHDILAAWEQWEADHPVDGEEPDFPDVRAMRGEAKPNPLDEA